MSVFCITMAMFSVGISVFYTDSELLITNEHGVTKSYMQIKKFAFRVSVEIRIKIFLNQICVFALARYTSTLGSFKYNHEHNYMAIALYKLFFKCQSRRNGNTRAGYQCFVAG